MASSVEYEKGQAAYRNGLSFDPNTKSAEFMRGYDHEKRWYQKYAEYKRNSSLFS